MTAEAAQVILAMCRARKVRVILPGGVAFQAALVNRLRGCGLEAEDLRFVPTAFDVVLSRTMAGFATLFRCATTLIQQSFPMRRLFKILVNVVMAGLALLRASILRGGAPQSALRLPIRKR